MDAIHADQAVFFRFMAETEELELELSIDLNAQFVPALKKLKLAARDESNPIGWVAVHREILNLPDVMADPRFSESEFFSGSLLLVPVVHAKQVLGVLGVLSESKNAFDTSDETLLSMFANQAAVALDNARLFNNAVHHLNQLQTLRAIDQIISGTLNLHVILNFVLSQIMDFLKVDIADILLLDPVTQTLKFAVGRGFHTDALKRTRLRFGEGYAGKAAMERRLIKVPDLDLKTGTTELVRSIYLPEENPVSYYAAPLVSKGVVRGVIEILHRSPLNPNQEWFGFLEAVATQTAIAIDNATMFEDLQRSNMDLVQAYEAAIEGWAKILDIRDEETEGHTLRVTEMTLKIAQRMGILEADLAHIHRGALLHDIGKIGIPDHILHKPAELDKLEWQQMRRHPEIGADIVSHIKKLQSAIPFIRFHHEHYDGNGYPNGLRGDQIPLGARILSVVDAYGAMIDRRVYRPAKPPRDAVQELNSQSGLQFDPNVVRAFLRTLNMDDGTYPI